jgi:hypothetical protein
MKFYGAGVQRKKGSDGEVSFVNVIIPLTETVRVTAVKQAERIARRRKIQLEGVYLEANSRDRGGILTKNMQKQKASKNKR